MVRTQTLAEVYRQFSGTDSGTSPLYTHAAQAVSTSDSALASIARAPARKQAPPIILAALYDLVLAGRAPELAAAFTAGDAGAVAREAVRTLVDLDEMIIDIVTRRDLRRAEPGRYAVLYPAVAEAAHRHGATSVGLIDVSCGVGLNLQVDRVGITYAKGGTLGDQSSPVQVTSSVVGPTALPTREVPEVVARVGLDRHPTDVTDGDEARWLRACLGPGHPLALARLEAELALASQAPPRLLSGDVVDRLPEAIASVPAGALPVVTTTWALSQLCVERRQRFRSRLEEASLDRPIVWVSVEGVGVAPTVPTLGDRPASGHSIIGLWESERTTYRARVLGRCWSRGRLLSWLPGS